MDRGKTRLSMTSQGTRHGSWSLNFLVTTLIFPIFSHLPPLPIASETLSNVHNIYIYDSKLSWFSQYLYLRLKLVLNCSCVSVGHWPTIGPRYLPLCTWTSCPVGGPPCCDGELNLLKLTLLTMTCGPPGVTSNQANVRVESRVVTSTSSVTEVTGGQPVRWFSIAGMGGSELSVKIGIKWTVTYHRTILFLSVITWRQEIAMSTHRKKGRHRVRVQPYTEIWEHTRSHNSHLLCLAPLPPTEVSMWALRLQN